MENWQLSIAPMVNHSTRQMRHLWRQLCTNCLLYTEMVPVPALLRGNPARQLDFCELEKPLALQLASNSPAALSQAVKLAAAWDYAEINLNVGCPSLKQTHCGAGVVMLKHPELTAECVAAMKAASPLPVTVKTRLGVDDWDDDEKLHHFVRLLQQAGVARVIIHARKAWLRGVNPKQNRSVPPLQYERVAQLQESFPDLPIILNGGINSLQQIRECLRKFRGIMIGRLAYNQPLLLAELAQLYWDEPAKELEVAELIRRQLDYARLRWQQGEPFRHSGIHLLNLYKGEQGARAYRQGLARLLNHPAPPSFAAVRSFLPQ